MLELQEQLVQQDYRESQAMSGLLVHKVLLVMLEPRAQLVQQDCRELQVMSGLLVHKVLLVMLEPQEPLELQAFRVQPEMPEQQVRKVHQEFKA